VTPISPAAASAPRINGAELPWDALRAVVAEHPEEHLFVVVAGSHLYGCPSPESDIDLRACHRVPTEQLFALERPSETVERLERIGEREVETVSHEVEKSLRLLLKRNGALLEQIFSPLVVVETPALSDLRAVARDWLTRGLYHHYQTRIYSAGQEYRRNGGGRVKPLLGLYRLAMTGIHLLRRGEVEANLTRLNEEFRLPQVTELIERKAEGEAATVEDDVPYLTQIDTLVTTLGEAHAASTLPDAASDRAALDAFLSRQRWEGLP
jgi:predicted nucleotidyltransferase